MESNEKSQKLLPLNGRKILKYIYLPKKMECQIITKALFKCLQVILYAKGILYQQINIARFGKLMSFSTVFQFYQDDGRLIK